MQGNSAKIFNELEKYKKKIGLIDSSNKAYSYNKILQEVEKVSRRVKKRTLILFLSSNKYLKILIINNYNIDKIKNLIYISYKINKNFILINKVKKFPNKTLFNK